MCHGTEAESAVAVLVHRFACETARHLAKVFRCGGEETEMRAAESGSDAERLGLAADDVEAEAAATGEKAERYGFGHDLHRQRTTFVGGLRKTREGLDNAEEIW